MLAHRDRDPHRLACACLCVSALFSWTLALAGLSSLVLVACSPAGRADAMLLLGGGEGDPEGAGVDAFVACGREYKLRWWTLFAHAGVWAGCAWAVAAGGRGRRQQHKQELQQGDGPDGGKAGGGGGNYSGDGLLRGAPPPPPPRLWPAVASLSAWPRHAAPYYQQHHSCRRRHHHDDRPPASPGPAALPLCRASRRPLPARLRRLSAGRPLR